VVAVDQDPLGKQGKRISSLAADDSESGNANQRPRQVWARELWDGTMAVGLFNIGESPTKVSVSLDELNKALNMNLTEKQPVRDLWQLKDLAPADSFSFDVPRHGMVFLKIGKARAEAECVSAIVKMHAPGR
jgi:alpha-galactosidase